jgi:peptide/nickel transport system substrate-binding protein
MAADRLALSMALLAACVVAACAPASPQRDASAQRADAARSAPTGSPGTKRITAAIPADPPSVYNAMNPPGVGGQGNALQELGLAGLTTYDPQSRIHPQLAEAVPSVENGQWRVLPDGRMETTWRIREGATWHDGAPFTAQDLAFTTTIVRDPDLPAFSNVNYRNIEGVDTTDARTVTVRWREPFIKADAMFAQELGAPLPRHLLEQPYLTAKGTFTELPYWGPEYVGTGPFRLTELERSSHMVFAAFDGYILGRPKVDQIEIRFVRDEAVIVAGLMAGAVDLTLSRALGPEHGFTLRDQWRDGRVEWDQIGSWFVLYPQFVEPNPAVIADLRFRRALLHATDRPELAETLIGDRTGVPHSIVHPTELAYSAIESSIVRYDPDPRLAAQLVESTGYTRGPDGFYQDSERRRLQLELNATPNDAHLKIMATLGDAWGRQGIGVEQVVIPRQRSQDEQYRATFPGLAVQGHPIGIERFHSREARLPERDYKGLNNTRYQNAELDGLIDRYFTTIPQAERVRHLAGIVRHVSDQVVVLPLAWRADPTAIASRMAHVGAKGPISTQAWNAHEWDIR